MTLEAALTCEHFIADWSGKHLLAGYNVLLVVYNVDVSFELFLARFTDELFIALGTTESESQEC